jgi:hypothetical protein
LFYGWRAACKVLTPMRHHAVTFLLAALAVVSGCSSKSESSPSAAEAANLGPGLDTTPVASGTRLRAKLVSGGGARALVGFHDTLRDEDCTFQKADGRMRCLPELAQYAVAGGFSDAKCQVPLTRLTATCSTGAKYALGFRYDGSCGPTPTELHGIGPTPTVQYVNGAGTCVPQPVPAGTPVLALGDVVPWTEFVAAVETVVPGTPSERVLVASDGARQHLGFRLDDLDAECTFQVMEDGVTRCVPRARGGNVYYADSACTKAAFVDAYPSGSCVSGTSLWLEASSATAGCGASRAVYSLGGSAGASGIEPGDGLFRRDASRPAPGSGGAVTETCSSMGRFSVSTSARVVKADLTPSLPVARRVGSGSGRLVPALVAKPGGVTLEAGFHDTELDVDCSFGTASDGKLRCLPATGPATVFFTDAACKSSSLVAVLGQVPCTGLSRFVTVDSKTCPATTRVYALGAESRSLPTGSTETAPGRCASFAGVSNAFDATEFDVTRFVEGSLLTE